MSAFFSQIKNTLGIFIEMGTILNNFINARRAFFDNHFNNTLVAQPVTGNQGIFNVFLK